MWSPSFIGDRLSRLALDRFSWVQLAFEHRTPDLDLRQTGHADLVGVRVEDGEVSQLAGLDAAEAILQVENIRSVDGDAFMP